MYSRWSGTISVIFCHISVIFDLYVIVNRCNCHTIIVIHSFKTADWQSKARNNKYLKTRERLKTYYSVTLWHIALIVATAYDA
jgi:hypothetical protein